MPKRMTVLELKQHVRQLMAEESRWKDINNGAAMGSYSCRMHVRDHGDSMIRQRAEIEGMAKALGLTKKDLTRLRQDILIEQIRGSDQ